MVSIMLIPFCPNQANSTLDYLGVDADQRNLTNISSLKLDYHIDLKNKKKVFMTKIDV